MYVQQKSDGYSFSLMIIYLFSFTVWIFLVLSSDILVLTSAKNRVKSSLEFLRIETQIDLGYQPID